MKRWVGSTLALLVAGVLPALAETRSAGLSVSVFALRGGRGDWSLTIEGTRVVDAVVHKQEGNIHAAVVLKEFQLRQLSKLVAKLPKDRKEYMFGRQAPDIETDFVLDVGKGAGRRSYTVGGHLEATDYGPDLKAVLEVLNFMHVLLGSKEASRPPSQAWHSWEQ